jgi:predicted nucleic acid-binding protein
VKVAYVDTSVLLAIAFGERGRAAARRRLESFDLLVASNLLEAELRAALHRENAPSDAPLLKRISWVSPERPLSPEITVVLGSGHLRGADLWHLACALYLARSPRELSFLTLDTRQGVVAEKLGFPA